MNSLSNKILRNLSGYGYSQGATLVAQIVVVPFFLAAWGVRQYGEWLVLTSIPMFLALMELGVAQASATRASIASGSKDPVGIRGTLDTAMAFSIVAAVCVTCFGTFLAIYFPWNVWLNLSDLDSSTATSVLICMSLYLAGNFLAGPVSAWMKAMDRTALSAVWMANRRVAEMIITAIALYFHASPVTLATLLMITSFATSLICYIVALRHSTVGAMTVQHASYKEFRVIFWPAISFMAMPLAQVITLQGGLQLLNALSGGTIVAAFSMARTMVRLLMQVGIVFNNAMRPEVSRLLGQGQKNAAINVVKKGSLAASIILIIGLCGVGFFGHTILEIWSHGKVILPTSFLLLLSLHAAINVIWFVPATFIFAQNRHSTISWIYMSVSIISLLLWWTCSSMLNPLSGAALMMLAPELLMCGILLTLQLSHANTKRQEKTIFKRIK